MKTRLQLLQVARTHTRSECFSELRVLAIEAMKRNAMKVIFLIQVQHRGQLLAGVLDADGMLVLSAT